MTTSPTCACFIKPEWKYIGWPELKSPYVPTGWYETPVIAKPTVGLTDKEKECLDHLARAWNLFVELSEKHPQDNSEFCTAIHDAQKTIALRVARRLDKDVWNQY